METKRNLKMKGLHLLSVLLLLIGAFSPCIGVEVQAATVEKDWNGLHLSLDTETGILDITGEEYTCTDMNDSQLASAIPREFVKTINIKSDIKCSGTLGFIFSYLMELETINGLERMDTTNVTDMSSMFEYCQKLTTVNVSELKLTNVETIEGMFYNCEQISELSVSNWEVQNVRDMGFAFYFCKALIGLDVSAWNTSSVSTFRSMFAFSEKIESLELSGWNTDKATDFSRMFYGCKNLIKLDISNFNTNREGVNTTLMLNGLNNLFIIKLGENTRNLPVTSLNRGSQPFIERCYTSDTWQEVNDGTLSDPHGEKKTFTEITESSSTQSVAGTWIWESKPFPMAVFIDYGDGTIRHFNAMEEANKELRYTMPNSALQIITPPKHRLGLFRFNGYEWYIDAVLNLAVHQYMPESESAKWVKFTNSYGVVIHPVQVPFVPFSDLANFTAVETGVPQFTYLEQENLSVLPLGLRTTWEPYGIVRFDKNCEDESVITPSSLEYTSEDDELTFPEGPMRDGFRFLGWATEDNPTTTYNVGDEVPLSGTPDGSFDYDTTYVAMWEEIKTYTVHYELADGVGEGFEDRDVGFNEDHLIPENEPTREGHHFKGWRKDNEEVTDITKFSDLVENEESATITLVAQWEKTYTVNYNLGGGEGGVVPPKTVLASESELDVVEPTDKVSKTGYRFIGWYTSPCEDTLADSYVEDCKKGNKITSTTKYQDISDGKDEITLYARWGREPLFILLVGSPLNAEQVIDQVQTRYWGQSLNVLLKDKITQLEGYEGYKFLGFSLTEDRREIVDLDKAAIDVVSLRDIGIFGGLYAKWQKMIPSIELGNPDVVQRVKKGETYSWTQAVHLPKVFEDVGVENFDTPLWATITNDEGFTQVAEASETVDLPAGTYNVTFSNVAPLSRAIVQTLTAS